MCRSFAHTRRGSEIRITDSAESFPKLFGYKNMKKAAILDPDTKKKLKFWSLLALFKKKSLKKPFLQTATI